ncbi:uncharacterized protein LOC144152640 [Haemaphysalis longicornis]
MVGRVVLFVALVQFSGLFGAASGARGPHKLQRELPDSFKIFDAFEHPIGIMDTNNDSVFECLSARRKDYDPDAQTVTYIWSIAGEDSNKRQLVPFHHTPGDTPDTTRFTVGSDSTVRVGRFDYTDYKNCAILEIPYFGYQCTLWVAENVKDSIPEECIIHYYDICGGGFPIYAKDICKGAYK